MGGQRASTPVRLVRWAAALVMVGLAVAVAVKLSERRPVTPSPAPAVAPPPVAGAVALQTRIRREEYRDGRLAAVVRGDAHSVGSDGRHRLKGGVEVVSYGPEGREASRLTADEVAYDREALVFSIAGRVRIESGGVVLEGDAFSYDKAKGLFGTTSGGRFSSKGLSGSAPEIFYAEAEDAVRLGGGFAAALSASDSADGPRSLSGRSLRYDHRGRAGRIEGQALIQGPDYRATAGTIAFVASADEAGLDTAVLEDVAGIEFAGPAAVTRGELRAEQIEVAFSREPSGLAAKAAGGVRLSGRSGEDGSETVAAPSILLNVLRKDGSWTWEARGGVRAELTATGGARRTVEGENAVFAGGAIDVSAASGSRAVAESDEARIEAAEIKLDTPSGSLYAKGAVTGVLKAGDDNHRTGFFARGEDVSFSCQRLETLPEAGAMLITRSVILRQGDASVQGDEIELAGDAGRMSGGGGVVVTMVEAGRDGRKDRTIGLSGRDLSYGPDMRTLTVSEKASLRLPEARLEAGTISAVVARDSFKVETLEAKTAVVVIKGRFTGRSEAAFYDAAAGRITLTGNPVLTDDKGGSARGAKLTFDLADDKILIENEGPGRAATVIRS